MLLERNENLRDKNSLNVVRKKKEHCFKGKLKENKLDQQKSAFTTKDNISQQSSFLHFVVTETDKIRFANLKKVLSHELSKNPSHFRSDFLQKHSITPEMRTRMVDWMIEVLSSFTCTQNTFFVAIDIMDSFLAKTDKSFEVQDIHLIGVTSMLLASKMEEIIPFKVSTVVDKMTHGKMSKKSIVSMENEILMTLDFKLLEAPSLFIFVEFLAIKLNFHNHENFP